MNRALLATAVASAAIGLAGAASASTVNLSASVASGSIQNYTVTNGSSTGNVPSAPINFSVNSNSSGVGLGTSFTAFCIEIDQNLVFGTHDYTPFVGDAIDDANVPSPSTVNLDETAVKALSFLFDNYFDDALASYANANAFQAAIWEVVYETSTTYSLAAATGETFSISNAPTFANDMLTALNGVDLTTYDINENLVVLSSETSQDTITMIPLPAPVFMGLVGLAGATIARRRMRQA